MSYQQLNLVIKILVTIMTNLDINLRNKKIIDY